MAIAIGDKVYLEVHAYHHYLGEVSEILGTRRVALINASKIHNCSRSWEEFFRDGAGTDTTYDYVGDVLDAGYIDAIRWRHELPKPKKVDSGKRGRR
jgi:hypothetical protein